MMPRKTIATVAVCLLLACSRKETPTPAPTEQAKPAATPAPATTAPTAMASGSSEANRLFKTRCVVCHGQSGTGDGPGAAALNPKPRNYRDAEWQKTVTDEEIAKIIVEGGAAVGKSPAMPANPDLASKPEVVKGLVQVIRGFAAAP